jgi:hypothetical protein
MPPSVLALHSTTAIDGLSRLLDHMTSSHDLKPIYTLRRFVDPLVIRNLSHICKPARTIAKHPGESSCRKVYEVPLINGLPTVCHRTWPQFAMSCLAWAISRSRRFHAQRRYGTT